MEITSGPQIAKKTLRRGGGKQEGNELDVKEERVLSWGA